MDLAAELSRALADRYALDAEVGRGGMATIFQAADRRHRRTVAIKVLDPALAAVIGADRFQREIEIAARLTHPHILPLLDSGAVELSDGSTCPFYVMPFIAGESLRDRLTRDGRLPPAEAVRLASEVAGALDYAHRNGVVHRDIKPENILLQDGQALVADFGIARAMDQASGARLTGTGLSLGTPAYMSPEQLVGDASVDARSDVYALGCVLYEMLAGAPAFPPEGGGPAIAGRLSGTPLPGASGAGLPHAALAVIRRALAPDPDRRYASAAEFRAGLEALAPGRGRRSLARTAVGAGVLAAVLAVAWLGSGGRRTDPIPSLAVQPLVNADQDSTTLYLSEGIHLAVIDLLRRLPQLTVIAPSLVRQTITREPELDLRALGERLRVAAVLTWNMRRQGDSLLLRTEVVRTTDGTLLWAQTYGRPLRNVLSLQSEIARTISDSLRLQLSGADVANLARQQTSDDEAWDLYLRGRHLYYRASLLGGRNVRQDIDSIGALADRILARDSNFAGGHLLRSWYLSTLALRGFGTPFGAWMDSAQAAARRAAQLDSTFGDPWPDLATPAMWLTDEWAIVREYVSRAVGLNPNLPQAHQMLAIYYAEIEGNPDSGLAHARRAFELEPAPYLANTLGDLYMRAGKYDSAVVVLRPTWESDPAAPGPRARLIRSYERLGRYADAITVRRASPDSQEAMELEGALVADGAAGYRRVQQRHLGERIDSLLRIRAGPRQVLRDTFPPLIEGRLALLHAQRGEWRLAADWVVAEYQRRPRRLVLFLTNPEFDSLAADPRIARLAADQGVEHLLRRRAAP